MLQEQDKETFIITRFINPNHFYLYDPNRKDDSTLETMEKMISKQISVMKSNINFSEKRAQYEHKIKRGDMVAYYWREKHKYIRCEVDTIQTFGYFKTYFLFALDYGVCLYTTNFNLIYEISEYYKFMQSAIIGPISLEILPIKEYIDVVYNKLIYKIHNNWSKAAMDTFKKHIEKAISIEFVQSTTKRLPYRGFLFGDLKLTSPSFRTYSMNELMISNNYAKEAENENEFFDNFLKTTIFWTERWNDYLRTGGILNTQSQDAIPLCYKQEILIKEYKKKHAIDVFYKETRESIDRVLEWKKQNEGFEKCIPDIDETEEDAVHDKITKMSDCSGFTNVSDPFISISLVPSNKEECWN
ncbi:hypothetical protein PVAND_005653 [Polypedilum vanderplanki]|uniref:Tudor domain-containing protein n=1 Tax=Polypedilum vanderplanki TaxID=319348 RepID=A0A9J6C1U4_POLVA|nr:hypothetical protein PVAND_005653 [Polypedilum vanderplanki]